LQGRKARGVLGVPDFRHLWLVGMFISVARWLEMLVIGVLVWEQTHSPFLVAAMTLLRLLPMGLFGATLGVAADRIQRRVAMVVVVCGQAALAASMAALAFSGTLPVWTMGLACFLSGAAWATDNPIRRMMLGEIVGSARMASAMSLDVVANNASRIVGPVLGGSILAAQGPAAAFCVSCLLYLCAVVAAARVRHRSTVTDRPLSVLRDTRESFALVLRIPGMRGVMIITLIYNWFGWPANSMVPVIGAGTLGLGPDGVGLLASMDGIGAFIGAMILAARAPPAWYRAIYVGGCGIFCAMAPVFALAPSAVPAGLALVVMGAGGAGFAAMQTTLVYISMPAEQRSRALGVLSVCVGLGLLGFLHLGLLADAIGAPYATAVIGAEGLVALVLTRRWWRHGA
jgi:predicted MFS family arabinose efflux permease